MPERPSEFLKKYKPVTAHLLGGTQYVDVSRYLSGEPRSKKFNAAALNDIGRFLKKKGRYKDGANGADRHSWSSDTGLTAYGLVGTDHFVPWLTVEISWLTFQLAYYGKGTPATLRKVLQVIDYYLRYAELNLDALHWNGVMDIHEYAYWYLGIDCNGFAGAYLETHYPALGVHGNYHINYWDSKMAKRESVADVRPGDVLSREGGGGTRHVAMIDQVHGVPGSGDRQVLVSVTHSSSSNGGLGTQKYMLKLLNSAPKWHLTGYYKFDHILAPVKK